MLENTLVGKSGYYTVSQEGQASMCSAARAQWGCFDAKVLKIPATSIVVRNQVFQ